MNTTKLSIKVGPDMALKKIKPTKKTSPQQKNNQKKNFIVPLQSFQV